MKYHTACKYMEIKHSTNWRVVSGARLWKVIYQHIVQFFFKHICLQEDSYAHQGCIYLIKKILKKHNIVNIITVLV